MFRNIDKILDTLDTVTLDSEISDLNQVGDDVRDHHHHQPPPCQPCQEEMFSNIDKILDSMFVESESSDSEVEAAQEEMFSNIDKILQAVY